MVTIKREDIEITLKYSLQQSNGYTYLPADNVIAAQNTLAKKYGNVLAYVKESKLGYKRFHVEKVNAKRPT